jgi:signal transduction histidine kinase
MRAIAWLPPRAVEVGWAVFAAANLAAMEAWPSWETIPFHFIWVSLTLLYGFRVWRRKPTYAVLGLVALTTGGVIANEARHGDPMWQEMFEVPLMSAMFVAMVWHARRRVAVMDAQRRFLHDASHELRTPVTIARGHLEALQRGKGAAEVALDELERIERITERLLLLAKTEQPDFVAAANIDVEPFLEDVFVRWSEVSPRAWRLGSVAPGSLRADPEALRTALDALVENAVKHTDRADAIELRALAHDRTLVLEVADEGPGIPREALGRIFDRFGRADPARSRTDGGAGLGLAIVSAIAEAHGGRCTVETSPAGTTYSLELPGFQATRAFSGELAFDR